MSQESNDLIAVLVRYLLGPTILLILGWLFGWLDGYIRNRGAHTQRKLARDETLEVIQILEKWLNAQEIACTPEDFKQVKTKVRERLNDILRTLEASPQTTQAQRSLLERLFLLNRPSRASGVVARVIFYVLIVFLVICAIGIPGAQPPVPIATAIAIYVSFGVFLVAVHAWAVYADSKPRIKPTMREISEDTYQAILSTLCYYAENDFGSEIYVKDAARLNDQLNLRAQECLERLEHDRNLAPHGK